MGEKRPVGVFDSGVGGLSVVREIQALLPDEDILYVADTAYCPYGDREDAVVRRRALAIGRHLEDAGAKLVVVACNTATGAALEQLREALGVPVVGLEPAVKTGVARTRNRRVGVMATSSTVRSERFARLVRDHAQGVTVVAQACPGLADLIEQGHLDDPVLNERLAQLARPLRESGVDTIVLGCTHYLFIRGPLARVLGDGMQIVDSGAAIARRTDFLLSRDGVKASDRPGRLRVRTTGDPARVTPVIERLWGGAVAVDAIDV